MYCKKANERYGNMMAVLKLEEDIGKDQDSACRIVDDNINDVLDGELSEMNFLNGIPASILLLEGSNYSYLERIGEALDCIGALQRDYRGLAAMLNYDVRNFNLFVSKKTRYKTIYIIKRWIKKEKEKATLFDLVAALHEMRRLDVIEIVLKAVRNHLRNAKDYSPETEKGRYFLTKMKRVFFENDNDEFDNISVMSVQSSMSTTSIYGSQYSLAQVTHRESPSSEHLLQNSQSNGSSQSSQSNGSSQSSQSNGSIQNSQPNISSTVSKQKDAYHPRVFVCHASGSDELIRKFLKYMRSKGLNATSPLIDHKFNENKAQYLEDNLTHAEFVLVVCNHIYDECIKKIALKDSSEVLDDDCQLIGFAHKFMMNDIFTNGGNSSKYIPILLADGGERKHVPICLSPCQTYQYPAKRGDLLRRLFQVENHELLHIGPSPPIKPQLVTSGQAQAYRR